MSTLYTTESSPFTAYIIGEESLATQCAELLLAQGHHILGIISSSPSIATWAQQHQVKWIDGALDWQALLLDAEFDYLFSIVNWRLLPSAILQKPRCFAVNYHDALLPRYAGVHATSWAILNQEQQHGITWHVMTETVDAGDILAQVAVTVDSDETALSLNLKCYQAALTAFEALIEQLSSQTYLRTPQDLSQRTYFGYDAKLPSNGLINWEQSAERIERVYRALSLGEYANRLGVLKVQLGKNFYVVDEMRKTDISSTQPSGTVIQCTENGIQIATQTEDICITQLKDFKGQIGDFSEVLEENALKIGDQLPIFDPSLCLAYENLSVSLFKHESFWVEQLRTFKAATLPFLSI